VWAAETAAKSWIGEVTEIQGEATVASPDGKKVRILRLNSRVQIGDKVQTIPGTTLKICFDDGSILSLGEKSAVIVDEYVYNKEDPQACRFMMRVVKGICRLVTGAITDLNPKGFCIKTQTAFVGYGSGDLGFRSNASRDDIYVLDLGADKTVRVNTTVDGRDVVNIVTNESLQTDPAVRKTLDIGQSNRRVSVIRGKGVEEAPLSLDERNRFISESSIYEAATYQMLTVGDGTVLTIQPVTPSKVPAASAP
jgi:hypothetical protein